MNSNKTILVLDGETRAALAIVRSLGRKGLRVVVASCHNSSLSGSSKYCSVACKYVSPMTNSELFVQSVRNLVLQYQINVLFPVTDVSMYAILQRRELFNDIVSIPFVNYPTYKKASDKIALVNMANRLGIPVPFSRVVDPQSRVGKDARSDALTFPVILKPIASIVEYGQNQLQKTGVRFAACKEDFETIITTDPSFSVPYMIQEVIDGDGIGVFAFCKEGEMLSAFSHHRIREKPPYGGVSVVCESTPPDQDALESSKKLLKELGWNGVVMVEFKRDRKQNNIPVLMEINARFWGSLQLAIDAGVDFPLFQYLLSQNEPIPRVNSYKKCRSRWLLGDVDHLIIRLKMPATDYRYPQRLHHKLYAVLIFIIEFFKGSRIEEFRFWDIGPFYYALKNWLTRKG